MPPDHTVHLDVAAVALAAAASGIGPPFMPRFARWLAVLATLALVGCKDEPPRAAFSKPLPIAPQVIVTTNAPTQDRATASEPHFILPPPKTTGGLSVTEAIARRRSHRAFASSPLNWSDLGQLAWAAQGLTQRAHGLRSTPSAGALYPLELYFVTPKGLYHYLPESHAMERRQTQDLRAELAEVSLGQKPPRRAPCTVVFCAVTARTAEKYGDRAPRYVALEAGHAAQNLLLEATSNGLVGVPIGAFDDVKLASLLDLPTGEEPIYLISVGSPVDGTL